MGSSAKKDKIAVAHDGSLLQQHDAAGAAAAGAQQPAQEQAVENGVEGDQAAARPACGGAEGEGCLASATGAGAGAAAAPDPLGGGSSCIAPLVSPAATVLLLLARYFCRRARLRRCREFGGGGVPAACGVVCDSGGACRCDMPVSWLESAPWLEKVILTPCSVTCRTYSFGCCCIAHRMSRRAFRPSLRPRLCRAPKGEPATPHWRGPPLR